MRPIIEQVRPIDVREQVVDLLWEHRHWPGQTRQDYVELWNWRYRALADGDPICWIVRAPDAAVVAHVAVFPRRFRLGTSELRAAVPGDLLIHHDWRRKVLAPRLIQKPIGLVHGGGYDFVLSFANEVAHRLLKLRGFKELGAFHQHVDLRRSAATLRSRSKGLSMLAPIVDAGLAIRRRRYRWVHHRDMFSRFHVERLGRDGLHRLKRDHWRGPSERIVGNDSLGFIERRFFESNRVPHSLFLVTDRSTSRPEGYAIVGFVEGRASVTDCQTNAAALDVPTALALVGSSLPRGPTTFVATVVEGSQLASGLYRSGFFPRVSMRTAPFQIAAYWSPQHELAEKFARLGNWSIMPASAEF